MTRDPIGYDGGANLYGYCGGNPVGFQDQEGSAPHQLTVVIVRNGQAPETVHLTSGGMTAFQGALAAKGWRTALNSTHTEAKFLQQTRLEPGDRIVMYGQQPPCNACKGALNKAAILNGVSIIYRWIQNGGQKQWKAGCSARSSSSIGTAPRGAGEPSEPKAETNEEESHTGGAAAGPFAGGNIEDESLDGERHGDDGGLPDE